MVGKLHSEKLLSIIFFDISRIYPTIEILLEKIQISKKVIIKKSHMMRILLVTLYITEVTLKYC